MLSDYDHISIQKEINKDLAVCWVDLIPLLYVLSLQQICLHTFLVWQISSPLEIIVIASRSCGS